jgi:hypothetical protein
MKQTLIATALVLCPALACPAGEIVVTGVGLKIVKGAATMLTIRMQP